jgi:hypothetical protein
MDFDIRQLEKLEAGEDEIWDVLHDYEVALVKLFLNSPEGQAYQQANPTGNGFWAGRVIEYGFTYLGVPLTEMSDTEMAELLDEVFPRKISLAEPEQASTAIPELIAFWQFLQREFQLPEAEDVLDCLTTLPPGQFEKWMNDPSKFGMAKSFFMMGQNAGFDMTDEAQINTYMNMYNAGILAQPSDPLQAIASWMSSWPEESAAPVKRSAKAKRVRKIAKASRKRNRRR